MITLNEITLDKKNILEKYMTACPNISSEFSFTNLFMWAKGYGMQYAVIEDMLCIFLKHGNNPRNAVFPIGCTECRTPDKIKSVINQLMDFYKENNEPFILRLYDETTLNILKNVFPNKFSITSDRDNFEYVYNIEELISLSGKKYHAKKNHINKFKTLYPNFEYCSLTSKDAPECLALFDRWQSDKQTENNENRVAVCRLFDNWDAFSIKGGGIRVDGKIIAFSIGEALTDNSVIIHLEHADTDYTGAFPMINQQFLEHQWKDFSLVNREEDMGIEGLRKAKLSYKPAFMIEKYVATLA